MTRNLHSAFHVLSKEFKDDLEIANSLYNLLPPAIKNTVVDCNPTNTKLWTYKFGENFKLPNNAVATGRPTQFPYILNLYNCIKLAKKYLTASQLKQFLKNLSNPAKHTDFLFEMRPILAVDSSTSAKYEARGYSPGNKTIDWLVMPSRKPHILIDVKHRQKSLVSHLIASLMTQVKFPAPNPEDLFKSALDKFKSCTDNSSLQGIWVYSLIKEDKTKLLNYFNDLDPTKIHFIILSDWKDDGFVLTQNEEQKSLLLNTFKLLESNRFVADYNAN